MHFHEKAILASKPKFATGKWRPSAYDPSTDMYKTFNDPKKTIAELKASCEAWMKRNKCLDHKANKDALIPPKPRKKK